MTNESNSTSPSEPAKGQTWFRKKGRIKVYIRAIEDGLVSYQYYSNSTGKPKLLYGKARPEDFIARHEQ